MGDIWWPAEGSSQVELSSACVCETDELGIRYPASTCLDCWAQSLVEFSKLLEKWLAANDVSDGTPLEILGSNVGFLWEDTTVVFDIQSDSILEAILKHLELDTYFRITFYLEEATMIAHRRSEHETSTRFIFNIGNPNA